MIVGFIIGMIENGVIYVIPIRFSLRPIIGSDSVNVILSIFGPFIITLAIILHYICALL